MQENIHNQEKNQSVETDPEVTNIMESADRDIKITVLNMLKDLRKI